MFIIDLYNQQESEIRHLIELSEELKGKSELCDQLNKQSEGGPLGNSKKPGSIAITVTQSSPKLTKPNLEKKVVIDILTEESEFDSELDEDDDKLDPDWRKTPLFKRIRSMKVILCSFSGRDQQFIIGFGCACVCGVTKIIL